MTASTDFNCPSCGSENTQKIALAHAAGTLSSVGGGVGLSVSRSGIGVLGGGGGSRGTTSLADQLAPPPPYEKFPYYRLGCFSILVSAACLVGLGLLGIELSATATNNVGFAIVGGLMLLMWFGHLLGRQEYNRNRAEALARWDRSFICLRCGNVWERDAPSASDAGAARPRQERYCATCDKPTPGNWNVCPRCGSSLR